MARGEEELILQDLINWREARRSGDWLWEQQSKLTLLLDLRSIYDVSVVQELYPDGPIWLAYSSKGSTGGLTEVEAIEEIVKLVLWSSIPLESFKQYEVAREPA